MTVEIILWINLPNLTEEMILWINLHDKILVVRINVGELAFL